ncbi:MAG: hypothetical protein KDD66_05070 [Bdellovibrionales bacterium]|nr:hypothetical protein [Bdellovibrionales bacterium]
MKRMISYAPRIIALALFCLAAPSIGSADPYGPGLLYPTGVEPGSASQCEATGGKKCWWVDADAPAGGNGTYASPYNSFETVVGYMNGGDYTQGQIGGGDYLYVKGTFSASNHNTTSNSMIIRFARASQGGTASQPTVVKSWRGQPRAIFDGEYLLNDMIHVSALSGTANQGVRIQNVEFTRSNGRGIYIDDNVKNVEIVSVLVHDGKGDGIMGVGGGISVSMTSQLHTFSIKNSVFYNNKVNKSGSDNNVGAIGILSEGGAQTGSKITLVNNVIYDEVQGIRHKHSGNIITEAYYNDIKDCTNGFYLRAFNNDIHHNVISNCQVGFFVEAENQGGNQNSEIYFNTLYNTPEAVDTGYETTSYQRNINFHDNVYYNNSQSDGVITLGRWGSNPYTISQWTSSKNFFYNAASQSFMFHQGAAKSFSNAMSYVSDGSSTNQQVQFENAAQGDFRLAIGSPGIGAGTGGADVGARPAVTGGAPSPPTGLNAE